MTTMPTDFFTGNVNSHRSKFWYSLQIFEYEELASAFGQTYQRIKSSQHTSAWGVLAVRKNVVMGDGSVTHAVFTRAQLLHAYHDVRCADSTNFIHRWLVDEGIPFALGCGVYQEASECPPNAVNLWTPFRMDLERGLFCYDGEGCRAVLHLVHVLCNGDVAMARVVMEWIVSAISRTKPRVALAFVGHPHCGTSMLLALLRGLLGDAKVHSTEKLSGDFHTITRNKMTSYQVLHYQVNRASVAPNDRGELNSVVSEWRHAGDSLHACLITQTFLPANSSTGYQTDGTLGTLVHPNIVRIHCRHEAVDAAYVRRFCALLSHLPTLRSVWAKLTLTSLWARARTKLRLRAIVLYWLFLTAPLMHSGGKAARRDLASFQGDYT
jgi:hypothetical protein